MFKKFLFQLGLGFVLIALVLTGFSFAAKPVNLQWSAGGIGGGWYTMASGIAELIKTEYPEINIKVVPGARTLNPLRVNNGDADLAWGVSPFDLMALKGVEVFGEVGPAENLRSLGVSFSDNYIHIVVSKDFKAYTVEGMIKNKNARKDSATSRRIV